MNQLNIGGQLLDLSTPRVMGILNVTPDSFYDGGEYESVSNAIFQVEKMVSEGTDIIDIGGFSSRPNAKLISEEEELSRILPVIKEVREQFPDVILSVDTYRAKVVERISQFTACIVNDITASSQDSNLLKCVSELGFPYILMHMKGLPDNMQDNPQYVNIAKELLDFFAVQIAGLRKAGINQVILDPGFGFGKSIGHNYTLLKKMSLFELFDLPILVGISRKSMIYKVLNNKANEALNGTTALHMMALLNGATILRAHDVKEAKETITLYQQIKKAL